MACKCSELDWRDVDQTAEHHPACTSGMRKYEGYGLLGDGQPVRLEEITESLLMLSEEKDFVSDLSRIPEWKGDGHTKEDCEKRFSDSSFGVDATARIGEFNFDAVFLELLEKHKDAIAEIVIAHIVNHTELGNQLLLEIRKGR